MLGLGHFPGTIDFVVLGFGTACLLAAFWLLWRYRGAEGFRKCACGHDEIQHHNGRMCHGGAKPDWCQCNQYNPEVEG